MVLSSVALLVEHGTCNARIVGLDSSWGHSYGKCTQDLTVSRFWIKTPTKWRFILIDSLIRSSETKQLIISGLEEQVEANLGTAMMYTLFEWAKDNQEALMENHQAVVTAVVSVLHTHNHRNRMTWKGLSVQIGLVFLYTLCSLTIGDLFSQTLTSNSDLNAPAKKKEKKEQLTKSQKRKITCRTGKD